MAGGGAFSYNSLCHLHSSKALKVHFLLCERRFFVLFLSSTVASQGRHYFVPVTERGSVQVCNAHRQLIVCANVFHLHVYNVNGAGCPLYHSFPYSHKGAIV